MPESKSNPNPRRHRREELEEQLLAKLKQAEAAFHSAAPEEKAQAEERYRQALERFNEVVVHRKMPPSSAKEP